MVLDEWGLGAAYSARTARTLSGIASLRGCWSAGSAMASVHSWSNRRAVAGVWKRIVAQCFEQSRIGVPSVVQLNVPVEVRIGTIL